MGVSGVGSPVAHLRGSPQRSHRIPLLLSIRGALSDAEIWGQPAKAGIWGRPEFSNGGTPAFVWPSDHTWCIAADVDPHWAGVGATVPTIERLIADRLLDAVAADPDSEQPAYR